MNNGDVGKMREVEFVSELVRAFGRECVYYSPQLRKKNGQQKELADVMILLPPYAVVFQLKWLHQHAEDFWGEEGEVERGRIEKKMFEAASQFKRLKESWRQDLCIQLPKIWARGGGAFTIKLGCIKHFIPVVVIDFQDDKYSQKGLRTNVAPVVSRIPDSLKEWGAVHCFLFRDFLFILKDLFTPGDLMTYLYLRERQVAVNRKFVSYSELDLFALYLTKFSEWNRTADSSLLAVEPNYYEALMRDRVEDFATRREKYRETDRLDWILLEMCAHFSGGEVEVFLSSLSRIKCMPALIKKNVANRFEANLKKYEALNGRVSAMTSVGRFSTILFPNVVYLVGVVGCHADDQMMALEYHYLRTLSHIVENGWQSQTDEVFMMVFNPCVNGVWTGLRKINPVDYDVRLTQEEINMTRRSFSEEKFKESEWSYLRKL